LLPDMRTVRVKRRRSVFADRRKNSVATLLVFATEMILAGSDTDFQHVIAKVTIKIDSVLQNRYGPDPQGFLGRVVARTLLASDQRYDHKQHYSQADVGVCSYGWFAHFLSPGSSRS
jgi:hypothetical protein